MASDTENHDVIIPHGFATLYVYIYQTILLHEYNGLCYHMSTMDRNLLFFMEGLCQILSG